MSTKVTSKSGTQDVWARFRDWLRAFDDIVHHDPNDALVRKVEQLERRLAQSEEVKPGRSA